MYKFIKKTLSSVVFLFVLIYFSNVIAADKVTVCHIPPGNPSNVQSIDISPKAIKAHKDHGDLITSLGENESGALCQDGIDNDCDGSIDAVDTDCQDVKYIFITSLARRGDFGGLSEADTICNDLANTQKGSGQPLEGTGTFTAWLSSSTTDAIDRISPSHLTRPDGFKLTNGTVVHFTLDGSGSFINDTPITITESGTVSTFTRAWTGTLRDGTKALSRTCGDWTGAGSGEIGNAASTGNFLWTENNVISCLNNTPLYCLEN